MYKNPLRVLFLPVLFLVLSLVPAAVYADTVTVTVSAGAAPLVVAVNPITNKIYVANRFGDNMTVINGADNSTATVTLTTGFHPQAVAVNSVTNKVYVVNCGSACGGSGNGDVTVINGADNSTTTVTVGTSPFAVAVNPVTNKIYVANYGSNNVTVSNGADNSTATVTAGTSPRAVAVNPVTNKIYVANYSSNNVTVIDGATNTTNTVNVGTNPQSVDINPITNKIYVANKGSGNVTRIDGATNATTLITAGANPYTVAVNPVTNKIYVTDNGSNTVTVIDGAYNDDAHTATVNVGSGPRVLAVNPETNRIYVVNYSANTVTVIDGATNTATNTVTVGTNPQAVAVNPVTNKIYVANTGSDTVTVIDGAYNDDAHTTTVSTGSFSGPASVAVNPVTNKIYVANRFFTVTVIDGTYNDTVHTVTISIGQFCNMVAVNPVTNKVYLTHYGDSNVTVIDGATNGTTNVSVGSSPQGVAVNAVTNKVYVANYNSANVTVIEPAPTYGNLLQVSIQRIAGNQTTTPTPKITFYPQNNSYPYAPRPIAVYYQLDTRQGAWTAATSDANGTSWSATLPTLSKDWHTLFYFASDGSDAGSINPVNVNGVPESSPIPGMIGAYGFTYTDTPTAVFLATVDAQVDANRINVHWTTGSELDVLGFNILRSATRKGVYVQRNGQMLRATSPGTVSGNAYDWQDRGVSGKTYFYKIEVLGAQGSFEWSEPIKVALPAACDAVLQAPTLASPANKTVVVPGAVKLKWHKQACATKYQVEVHRGKADGTVVFKETVSKPSAVFTAPAPKKQAKYYWRVRACNTNGCAAWSELSLFVVK